MGENTHLNFEQTSRYIDFNNKMQIYRILKAPQIGEFFSSLNNAL